MQTATVEAARRRLGKKGRILIIVGLALVTVAAAWGIHYWLIGQYRESTDDAYLQADSAVVTPQVSGTVEELRVVDNQQVKAGDVLVVLDSRDSRARMAQSEAALSSAKASVDDAQAQIAKQEQLIAQAQAQLDAAQAEAQFASQDAKRYGDLQKQGASSEQLAQKSRADARRAEAARVEAQAVLETTRKQLDVLKAGLEKSQAEAQRAEALVGQDKLNVGYATITAAIDGIIADRSIERGQFVQPGTRMMSVVPVQSVYLIANYKETQVGHMYRGAPVRVTVDAYPGHDFTAKIDSLSPGTGAQFALLPPENATGNFTKIVQRVPVKIVFDQDNKNLDMLRPGLSVTAVVNTHDAPSTPATAASLSVPLKGEELAHE